jgi:hypothetical protein
MDSPRRFLALEAPPWPEPARAVHRSGDGERDLSTTQRYMHLSPRAIEEAIRLLEGPRIA